ncbi:MAG: diguanylate cyclase [Desulfobacterales bacterium]
MSRKSHFEVSQNFPSKDIHILIVDDDATVRYLMNEFMETVGYTSHMAASGEEAIATLGNRSMDVVITDIMMPGIDGLELTGLIRQEHNSEIIVMTGYSGDYSYEEVIRRGASDFVFKPVRFEELLLRLKRVLRERYLKEKLQKLAITDDLTQLYNFRHFDRQLKLETGRSIRYSNPLSLILLDIDHLKFHNDTYGHLAVNHMLAKLGQTIRRTLRRMDSAYRYGGDEFMILLPETGGGEAKNAARRIADAVSAERFEIRAGEKVDITMSIGVAEYCPGENPETFISRANRALSVSKERGRNRITADSEIGSHITIPESGLTNRQIRCDPSEKLLQTQDFSGDHIHILIVDDDMTVRYLMKEFMETAGYSSHMAASGEEALDKLKHGSMDVVITDIMMPGMNGLELTGRIRQEEYNTEVIVMTGYSGDYSYEEVIKKGASDFVFKPVRFEELLLRLRRVLRERSLREELEKLIVTDDLTQLYNVRHFYRQLKLETQRCTRYRRPLSLLLLDIDHFKSYNDIYGYLAGNLVLANLGQTIRRMLRRMDSAYRYGGEEFTILLPETGSEEARNAARRIGDAVSAQKFAARCGREVHITVSIGVAEYCPGEDPEVFVKRADMAMFASKEGGRNRITFFSREDMPSD